MMYISKQLEALMDDYDTDIIHWEEVKEAAEEAQDWKQYDAANDNIERINAVLDILADAVMRTEELELEEVVKGW